MRAIGLLLIAAAGLNAQHSPGDRSRRYCSATAHLQFLACSSEVVDDLYTAQALCTNLEDDEERRDCFGDALAESREERTVCRKQQTARQDLCDVLGEDRYDPDFDPESFDADFENPLHPHPYFPLEVGNRWVYQGGDEVFSDEVLDKTKLIDGVTCRVVQNRAVLAGRLIELTDDWYARKLNGDIVYCGESVQNFETFAGDDPPEPELVDLDGSFKAGDGALSGLLFPRNPLPGQIYRQEFAPGDAEDVGEVLTVTYGFGTNPDLDEHVPAEKAALLCPAASSDCVVTRDYSPIEPGPFALKYYARGVGFVFEVEYDEEGEVEVFEIVACNMDPRCELLEGVEEIRSEADE